MSGMLGLPDQELLSVPDAEGALLGSRARSASDAAVLRRKGHLKEQDMLIEFLLAMHGTHTSAEAMAKVNRGKGSFLTCLWGDKAWHCGCIGPAGSPDHTK